MGRSVPLADKAAWRDPAVAATYGATHFVHLDRPERGREQFIREVLTFIGVRDGRRIDR